MTDAHRKSSNVLSPARSPATRSVRRPVHRGRGLRDPAAPAGRPAAEPAGRPEAIRAGIGAFQQDDPGAVDPGRSGYVLHDTADPDVFIAEIDAVADGSPFALVQIFRLRDGRIAHLRDYFPPP